jgi:hypothetical protein
VSDPPVQRRSASVSGRVSGRDQRMATCVGGLGERERPAARGTRSAHALAHAFRLPRTPHELAHALAHATR